jgi:6-pyruvoyltetrahydropterin/6-carboxytetrahydropterin synthase
MLLPTQHPRIRVETEGSEVTARYGDRRWVFPADECVLMPLAQTTAELIARWIGEELLGLLPGEALGHLEQIQVEVEENFGQWAICEIPVESL